MSQQRISKGVGIDLGTTNSAVAVMNPADSEVIIYRDPRNRSLTTPSCVYKDPRSGRVSVGAMAFRRRGTLPEPVRSVKRKMGRNVTVDLSGERVRPEQISAYVLRELKRQIEDVAAGWESATASWLLDRAVITVPAYFDQPAIDATRKAAGLAGLAVVELLHEPTAAAVHHCWRTDTTDGVFLVYDLGGGTFDVSVVRCTAGAFEVLGISGNNRLGGDDIDRTLALELLNRLQTEDYALDLDIAGNPEDRIRFHQLELLAEGVKKALSHGSSFLLSDTASVKDKNGNPVYIDIEWYVSELEDVVRPIVERTMPYCREALQLAQKRAGITIADVDEIILAGGSTHIPLVRDIVRDELCAEAKCTQPVYDEVDTIVARGAAIQAATAGGLVVTDPGRQVRFTFHGTGSARDRVVGVGGRIDAVDSEFEAGTTRLHLVADDHEDECDVTPDGRFVFEGVPLQPEADNLLTFELHSEDGDLIGSATRVIAHGGGVRFTGRPVTDLAKVAKALLLRVNQDGHAELKELVPALASLPANRDYTFEHPGNTDVVVFSLYQRQREIQVIRVPVPMTTPRGTTIKLTVHLDALSLITVRGTIGGVAFDAIVELPPEREAPTPDELETLARQFRENAGYLPAGERAVAEAQWRRTRQAYDDAEAAADIEQCVHEFGELEDLTAGTARQGTTLEPPKKDFGKLVDDCHELNGILTELAPSSGGRPYDGSDMTRSIELLAEQGEQAYRESDQHAYSLVITTLDNVRLRLASEYRRKTHGDLTEEERAAALVQHAQELGSEVSTRAAAVAHHTYQQRVMKIQEELKVLAERVPHVARAVLRDAGKLVAELGQMQNVLANMSVVDSTLNWIPVDREGWPR